MPAGVIIIQLLRAELHSAFYTCACAVLTPGPEHCCSIVPLLLQPSNRTPLRHTLPANKSNIGCSDAESCYAVLCHAVLQGCWSRRVS
jgi:hypothetical protein